MASSPADNLILLWAARSCSYSNPYEGHSYFSLPFCHFNNHGADLTKEKREPSNLGELMGGDAWEPFAVLPSMTEMLASKEGTGITLSCSTDPTTAEEAHRLSHAVEHRWFYQLYPEDMPAWGMLGELLPSTTTDKPTQDIAKVLMENDRAKRQNMLDAQFVPHIYTKRDLYIVVDNENRVVKADLTSDPNSLLQAKVEANKSYTFQLDVHVEVGAYPAYRERFDRYVDHAFFSGTARTTSTANSLIEASFLLLLVGLLLSKLWKFNNESESMARDDLEKGMSQTLLPGIQQQSIVNRTLDPKDAFAPPKRVDLLAALIGNGWHLLVCAFAMVVGLWGTNPVAQGPGGRLGRMIYVYAATSIVAGYSSAYYFQQQDSRLESGHINGESRRKTILVTLLLIPAVALPMVGIIAIVSIPVETIDTISRAGAMKLFLIWVTIVVPSHSIGGFLGHLHQSRFRNAIEDFLALSIQKPKSEEMKKLKYFGLGVTATIGGCLSLGTVICELFYVMTAAWSYKNYVVNWIDVATLILLMLVNGAMSSFWAMVSLQKKELVVKWQWNAFVNGASTGLYVFGYSIYFYTYRLQLDTFYSKIHHFGTMVIFSVAVGLVCGSIGHAAAYQCFRLLYSNVKAA